MIGNMDEQRIKKGRMSGLENVSKRKVGTLGRRLSQEVRLSRHKVQQSNQRRGQTGHPQKASMERKGRTTPHQPRRVWILSTSTTRVQPPQRALDMEAGQEK